MCSYCENLCPKNPSKILKVEISLSVLKLMYLSEHVTDSSELRQRLHGTGSVWNRNEIGTDKPYVYTGSGGSGMVRICYLVLSGSTYEGDPIWNCTIPVSNRSRVNRVNPYHSGSDPIRI